MHLSILLKPTFFRFFRAWDEFEFEKYLLTMLFTITQFLWEDFSATKVLGALCQVIAPGSQLLYFLPSLLWDYVLKIFE